MKITPLRLCSVLGVPEEVKTYGVRGIPTDPVTPVYAYLLQPDDGDLLVFDAGCPPPAVAAERGRRGVVAEEGFVALAEALRAVGVDPESVTRLVLSHLHWDHCFGIADLPNAEVVVQRTELQYAFAPDVSQLQPYDSWELGRRAAWADFVDRIRPITGRAEIADGVSVIELPGHTPGSQGVVAEGPDGQHYCCCGDLIFGYDNWWGIRLGPSQIRSGPIPPGIHNDLTSWRESIAQIARNKWIPLPAHDSRAERVLAEGLSSPGLERL